MKSMSASENAKILVVDDDARLRDLLEKYLQDNGFEVEKASGSKEAYKVLQKKSISLVVLDWMMPEESGLQLIQRLRADHHNVPILMLTALGESENRIEGLEQGADDYLSKPFEPKELLLRIQRILQRAQSPQKGGVEESLISLGKHQFDLRTKSLLKEGEIVYLTSLEQSLLEIFSDNLGHPLSREDLMGKMGIYMSPRTVDVQITRLRRKIEENPKKPLYLRTIRHKGYALWSD